MYSHYLHATKKKTPSKQGFTLVELMVALTLFTIVTLAAVSALYTVNSASRKVQAMRTVMDNLNFAVESISRTVRTGSSLVCGGSGSGVANCPFANQSPSDQLLVSATLGGDQLVEYALGSYTNGNGAVKKRVQTNGVWTNWMAMTAPEINIQTLSFYVDGATQGDSAQPQVVLFMSGTATAGNEVAPFSIQTFISQRAGE